MAKRRSLASAGLFGPWHVDSATVPATTDEVRVTQVALEALVATEVVEPYPIEDPAGDGDVGDGIDPAAGVSICGAEVPLAWWEIDVDDGTPPERERYAKVPINIGDPKEPRVDSLGIIRRALSNEVSQFQGSTVSPVFFDTDRRLRGLEDSDSLVNRRACAYVSSEAAVRAGLTPRRVFDGKITDADPLGGLKFQIQVTDFITILLDNFQKRTFPSRVFNLDDFPNMGNPESHETSPGNPSMVGKPVPVGYGPLSDEGSVDPVGVFSPIYTGKRAIAYYGGALWDEYVWFCHSPTIGDWALHIPTGGGLSTGTEFPSRARITGDSGVVEYMFPGSPQWLAAFGVAPYRDFNGRRYCVSYAFGPRSDLNRTGRVPLVGSIPGIEDVGDGTGLMITSIYQQILHALINWFLPDTPYQSGAWLGIPSVGDGAELYSRLNTDSFVTAQAYSANVMGTVDGFLGAFLIGANGTPWTLKEFMETAAKNGRFDWGINKDGQLFISVLNPDAALVRSISDVTDTIAKSFRAKRQRDQIRNVVNYRYQRRYAEPLSRGTPAEGEVLAPENIETTSDWLVDNQQLPAVLPTASTTKYGERVEELDLELIRDPDTADQVAQLTLEERQDAPLINGFTEGPCGTLVDLGDRVELDHFEGVTATGYTNRSMRCQLHVLDLDKFTVDMEHRDLTGFGGAS